MSFPFFMQTGLDPLSTPLDEDDTAAYRALPGRWLIDLALLLNWWQIECGRHPLRRHNCWVNDEFLALTGLAEPEDDEPDEDDEEDAWHRHARSRDRLVRLLQQRRAELARIPVDPDSPLARNINWLAELLGLNEAEQATLCFAVFLQGDRIFSQAIAQQPASTSTPFLHELLARLTGLPRDDIA